MEKLKIMKFRANNNSNSNNRIDKKVVTKVFILITTSHRLIKLFITRYMTEEKFNLNLLTIFLSFKWTYDL